MSSGIISHVKGVTCHVRYFNHVKWYYKSRQRCYISRQIFQYMSSSNISHVKGVTYHVRYFNTCQVVLQVTSEVLHVTPDITIHVIWYYKSRQRCYMSRQIFQYMSSGIISHVKGVTCHVRYYNSRQRFYKPHQVLQFTSFGIINHVRCCNSRQVVLQITSSITIHVKWHYKSLQRYYKSRQVLQNHVRYYNSRQIVLQFTSNCITNDVKLYYK